MLLMLCTEHKHSEAFSVYSLYQAQNNYLRCQSIVKIRLKQSTAKGNLDVEHYTARAAYSDQRVS